MPDMDLQQKITQYSIDGHHILGKEMGQLVTEPELDGLRVAGKINEYLALTIIYIRGAVQSCGQELTENAPCYRVCEALSGIESEESYIGIGSVYLMAMHHFMTPKEIKIMAMDLEDALEDNNSHVKKILAALNMAPEELEETTFTFDQID